MNIYETLNNKISTFLYNIRCDTRTLIRPHLFKSDDTKIKKLLYTESIHGLEDGIMDLLFLDKGQE